MSSLGSELPRMMARVARRAVGEAELPPGLRQLDVDDALAAVDQAAEAIATGEVLPYLPAFERLKAFDA